ncbi:MAG: hypothetical protein AAGI28_08975 [Pseudomonadota bacterium]
MLTIIFLEYRGLIQDVLLVALCIAAFIWGGGPEKAVAATWLVVFELAGRVQNWLYGESVQLSEVDWFLASCDVLAGFLFVWIALYANRNYTLWIAGVQILAVTSHLARSLADVVSPIAYAAMVIGPGWIQLVLLGVGIARHVRRGKKHGKYRDWRISKPSTALTVNPVAQGEGVGWQQAGQPSWRDDLK